MTILLQSPAPYNTYFPHQPQFTAVIHQRNSSNANAQVTKLAVNFSDKT